FRADGVGIQHLRRHGIVTAWRTRRYDRIEYATLESAVVANVRHDSAAEAMIQYETIGKLGKSGGLGRVREWYLGRSSQHFRRFQGLAVRGVAQPDCHVSVGKDRLNDLTEDGI